MPRFQVINRSTKPGKLRQDDPVDVDQADDLPDLQRHSRIRLDAQRYASRVLP